MKACVQIVSHASLRVDGEVVSSIGYGLLVLFCAEKGDSEDKLERLTNKILKLRIFEDENGKMNRSVLDIGGEILVVSQFTLSADPMESGNRPSFSNSMEADKAKEFYEIFVEKLRKFLPSLKTGVFGALMKIELELIGPCTINFSL